MISLFGKKPKPKIWAVVDAGSHTLEALVYEEKEEYPLVIKKMAVKLPGSPKPSRIIEKLREMIFLMTKELGRIPEKISIGLHPYIADQTYDIWNIRPVNKIKSILPSEMDEYFQSLVESARKPDSALLAFPIEVFINGYSVSAQSDKEKTNFSPNKLGGTIDQITFKVVLFSMASEVGNSLSDLARSLGGMPIEFVPAVIAERDAVLHGLKINNFLGISIDGEDTSLSLVREGEIKGVSNFSFGVRHFFRGVAEVSSLSLREAEAVLREFSQGKLNDKNKQKIEKILNRQTLLWKDYFLQHVYDFYQSGPFPETVLVFGEGANYPQVITFLVQGEWFKNFSSFATPKVRVLSGPTFFEGHSLGGFLKGPEEADLAALMYYSKYHEHIF